MDALGFLDTSTPPVASPVYVIFGEDRFLQRQVLQRLRQAVLPQGSDDFTSMQFHGDDVELARVRDELLTIPFGADCRLVVLDEADGFVSKYRKQLEKYFEKPSPTGVLILLVRSWPSNTTLAKKTPAHAAFDCKAPKEAAVKSWLVRWTSREHGKKLTQDAAGLLIEFIGLHLGVLSQEVGKLTAFVGNRETIQVQDVEKICGSSRVETTWKMLDALALGDAPAALAVLHKLLDHGEDPLAIMGAVSWQLRKLVQVARLMQQERESLAGAMTKTGLPPFKRDVVGRQLQLLGDRINQVYDWVLEVNLSLKSSESLPPIVLLERLLLRLV